MAKTSAKFLAIVLFFAFSGLIVEAQTVPVGAPPSPQAAPAPRLTLDEAIRTALVRHSSLRRAPIGN